MATEAAAPAPPAGPGSPAPRHFGGPRRSVRPRHFGGPRRAGWARAGLWPATAVLMLVLGPAACSTVPTGGTIVAARGAGGDDPLSQPYVRILPAPPKPNASPRDIVTGFLAASASFDDPLRGVARQYLTGEAQRTWSPFDARTIYDSTQPEGEPLGEELQRAHVTVKGTVLGTIDGDGHYVASDASPDSRPDNAFTLVKVGGQWRISAAPAGLLLSNDDFKRAYRAFDLYFGAAGVEGLVADQVRVPIDPSVGLAKSLVRKLLDGPTRPLQGAVESAFKPADGSVDVDVNDVFVEGDVVVVDFTYGVVEAARAEGDRRALSAQLSWTLKPLTEARRIEVRVNGEQFPGAPFFIDPQEYEHFSPDVLSGRPGAYFLKDGRLHDLDKETGNPVVPGDDATEDRRYTGLAVSNDLPAKVAALDKEAGVWVRGVAPGNPWQRWIQGTRLTQPSWDRYGDVWSVSRTGTRRSAVFRARDASRQIQVPATGLESSEVKAFRVARDGARVAVISDDGHGDQVLVGSINRTGGWAVQNLRALIPPEEGQRIRDIAWQDASTLLVLTDSKSDRELTPWSVTQGIRLETAKAAARIESISAAPGPVAVLAGTAGGEVLIWDPKKSGWVTLVAGDAGSPVYPLG
ncbi:LpqB family beta-propeller domain-containing protein [Sphaerisporangium sp. TRM90804]|uniref:LpqB family beta-propeller domain-containing protein n=1 Tax=Sphaerisporangium sp. TRM90804 TaxID=3031113 RepID=UPI00244A49C7|nr:LpqB family beta-propeller domain-containing protein [Sphaerisporangium sp. TRM90804]MDH2427857.1 LpqB family beta-propeller domain-containing protein [Sphaerisporangium sp. TRM90804]